jgi:glycine amidinotransferase
MTEYNTLKRVVVGVENYENSKIVDATLKHFFKDNLKDYYRDENFTSYNISNQCIEERKQDLDNLVNVLLNEGIEVVRPNECSRLKTVKTPYFNSVFYSNSNVRDLTLTVGDKIITSQTTVRSRYFENIMLNDILNNEISKYDKTVISSPLASLQNDKLDFCDWREYVKIDDKKFETNYEILFDAANCIKVTDSDIIMNIGNRNHYNGYIWLQRVLPLIKIHPVYMCDNHIDGTLLPIREGVFLVNSCFLKNDIKNYLPKRFHNWEFITVNEKKLDPKIYDQLILTPPQLATYEGIDMNVLSISPNKIIVQNSAVHVIDKLDRCGFSVLPIQFRHGVLFGGGIHCSTLDLERDD